MPSAVTKAEILFAMQSVMPHFTHNSCNGFPAVFKLMLPDSEIASDVLLGRAKLCYVVNYGLAPFFRGKLLHSVSPKFTSCFGESFNRISKRKHLDIHLNYFDNAELLVKRHYIGSQYMGTATTA